MSSNEDPAQPKINFKKTEKDRQRERGRSETSKMSEKKREATEKTDVDLSRKNREQETERHRLQRDGGKEMERARGSYKDNRAHRWMEEREGPETSRIWTLSCSDSAQETGNASEMELNSVPPGLHQPTCPRDERNLLSPEGEKTAVDSSGQSVPLSEPMCQMQTKRKNIFSRRAGQVPGEVSPMGRRKDCPESHRLTGRAGTGTRPCLTPGLPQTSAPLPSWTCRFCPCFPQPGPDHSCNILARWHESSVRMEPCSDPITRGCPALPHMEPGTQHGLSPCLNG